MVLMKQVHRKKRGLQSLTSVIVRQVIGESIAWRGNLTEATEWGESVLPGGFAFSLSPECTCRLLPRAADNTFPITTIVAVSCAKYSKTLLFFPLDM